MGDRLPLIGVRRRRFRRAAWTKIEAGASLIQLYSALVYDGPGLVDRIKAGLLTRMAAEGVSALHQVVGRGAEDLTRAA